MFQPTNYFYKVIGTAKENQDYKQVKAYVIILSICKAKSKIDDLL